MLLPSGSLRHVVLSQLCSEPMHGYGLRHAAGEYGWVYPINNAAVYPVLHELEEEKLVTHTTEVHRGRLRKVYSITQAGREELRRWLACAPDHELAIFDSAAFKIAAYQDETIRYARGWVEESVEKLRLQIEDREQWLEREVEKSDYARMAGEYGIDMLRLRLRLLESVLDRARSDEDRAVASSA